MTTNPAPNPPAASQPFRPLALIGAALAGWTAARLPAAIATHGRLTATTLPQPAASPKAAAAPNVQAPLPQLQPIYITVPQPALQPASQGAAQIIHIHQYGPSPEQTAPLESAPTAIGQLQPAPQMVRLPPASTADVLATAAYDKLRQCNKREAIRLFEAALASESVSTPDPDTGVLTSPLLGASQSGAALGYTVNPLARRPPTVMARLNATDAAGRTDPRTTQTAFGLRYQALSALAVSAERFVSLGELARDEWLLRLSSGITRQAPIAGKPLRFDAYGEMNLLGNGDILATGKARALGPLYGKGAVNLAAGLGSWGSVQNSGAGTIGRFDVGSSAAVRLGQGRLSLELTADYRQRLAGQALPAAAPRLRSVQAFRRGSA